MARNLTEQVRGIATRRDRGRQRRPRPQAEPRRARRDRDAGRHDQQHDRHAVDVRRAGDRRRARRRRRRPPRRPGRRAGRRRRVARPDEQRQRARRQPDQSGPRDPRRRDRGDAGRPDAVDHRRSARRDRAAQGHRQPDDPDARGDHEGQPGAGLAQDERRALHPHAAGPARSAHRRAPDPQRARAARERPPRRVLHDGDRRRGPGAPPVRVATRTRSARTSRTSGGSARASSVRPRSRASASCISKRAAGLHPDHARARRGARRTRSSSCRSCSRARSRASSSWRRSRSSAASSSRSSTRCSSRSASSSRPSRRRCAPTSCCASRRASPRSCAASRTSCSRPTRSSRRRRDQLTEQKAEVEKKNRQVELARQELEEKAEQLALTSKYKSQFLANMSHELRTPLNSLLILSRQLADNAEGNLTDKQIRYAETIRQAGTDLMTLINEILDLAKIESGTMAVEVGQVRFAQPARLRRPDVPPGRRGEGPAVRGRARREPARRRSRPTTCGCARCCAICCRTRSSSPSSGRVKLAHRRAAHGDVDRVLGRGHRHRHPAGQAAADLRGVPASRRLDEPQVRRHRPRPRDLPRDRRPARRRPARRLGRRPGQHVHAVPADASTSASARARAPARSCRRRTLQPPQVHRPDAAGGAAGPQPIETRGRAPRRSRARSRTTTTALEPGDRVLLVVEDDLTFAMTMLEMARASGLQGRRRDERPPGARARAQSVKPDAITLDLRLPDLDGWVLLDRLKHDRGDAAHPGAHRLGSRRGAARPADAARIGFLQKPVTRRGPARRASTKVRDFVEKRVKQLLVVEDDPVQSQAISELIGDGDVETTTVASGEGALAGARRRRPYDCVVLDLRLPGMSGLRADRADQGRPAAPPPAGDRLHRAAS